MSERVGSAGASLIVHVSGAVLSAALLLARGGEQIQKWTTLPWYMLLSGASGVVLYLVLAYTVPKLGATATVALVIVGQLGMGVLIDHFGWLGVPVRPIDITRLIGMALLFAGGLLIARQ
jgi:transporter family-2 protein